MKGCGKGIKEDGTIQEDLKVVYPYKTCGKFGDLCKECVKKQDGEKE